MKVIYSRLYEKGMLGLDSMQILTNAADIDMETNDVSFRIDDIQNMFKHIGIFERLSRIKQVLKTKQKSKKVIRKPNTYWRRKSYHLINNFIYENILHLIVFLNCISIMTCFLTNPKPRSPVNVLCLICDLFFALVYTLQMIVSILGKSSRSLWDGIRRYFSSFWDIFDFVIVITSWVCFADSIYELHETSESKMRLFRTVSLFRMIRIVRLGKLFAPAIDKLADMETNNILTEAYDLGKGYISTVQEILTMLPYMIDNKDVREDTRVRLEIKQSLISRELNLVQMRRPWIGIRNKTNQAIHRTINVMIDAVGELKSAGLIDDAERTKILNSLLKQLKYIQGIKSNAPNSPRVLFEEVSWMGEDKALIDFLFTNIVIKSYEPSEMIINEGDHAPGVCIMITGLLTVNYKPVEDVLKDLVKEGALPVSDYLPYYKFEATTIDYIVSGNSFGELNFLTKRPYACQIVADSLSQVYMVTNDIMEYALEVDNDPVNGLRSRMWKLISTRVATAILMEVPMYRSTRDDEVRYCLERAFVPDLSKYLVFVKLSLIEDILLIEGIATDLNTKESFVAPCYIPRNVKRISLHTSTGITGNVKTILLIIPTKDVTPHDLMEKEEKAAELIKDAGEKVGALDLEDTKIKRKKRKGVSSNKQDNSSGSSSEGSKKGDQNKEVFSTLRKKRQSTVVEQSLTSPQ